MMPYPWNLEYPHDISPNASQTTLIPFIAMILKFRIFNIINTQIISYLELKSRSTLDIALIIQRVDFFITIETSIFK